MKNKASLIVLLAEIVAIVILHGTRLSRTETDKTAAQSRNESVNFSSAEPKQPVMYTSLK